jgi:NO-binding membrane sensor protein with MHYT domain
MKKLAPWLLVGAVALGVTIWAILETANFIKTKAVRIK